MVTFIISILSRLSTMKGVIMAILYGRN